MRDVFRAGKGLESGVLSDTSALCGSFVVLFDFSETDAEGAAPAPDWPDSAAPADGTVLRWPFKEACTGSGSVAPAGGAVAACVVGGAVGGAAEDVMWLHRKRRGTGTYCTKPMRRIARESAGQRIVRQLRPGLR